ncbi:MAG: type II toxin-antitoxin system HicB family antitoxin [Acidimicrobiaceae bacterium]|nr:type II toxin-antitoxin system HicB family antitoxin [Acidimicrobiaceae bacterium]
MRYVFPCAVELDEEHLRDTGQEGYNASFPDVHGAHTCGDTVQEVSDRLQDCLEVALGGYLRDGEDLPEPSDPEPDQVLVAVSPAVAGQFALHEAMLANGVTAAELARRIGLRPSHAKRLTDIYRPAKPDEVERALAALGLQMVSEATPLEQWTPSHDPAPAR